MPIVVHRHVPQSTLTMLIATIVTLVVLANAASSYADESRSMRFQHLSRDSGLSQSFVYTIVQDQQGYMWFGTQEGLNRFDGFEFRVFANDPADPTSLSDESIRTMIADSSGVLWIGTDAGGLSRYDAASETFVNYLHDPGDPESISDNRIRVVYEDRAGVIWVGTDGSGLDRFDRETSTFSHFAFEPSSADGISNGSVWDILEDSEGSLWIATADGLNRLDRQSGRFTRYFHDPARIGTLSDNKLRVLYEDVDNRLWIGTESGGLNRFDPASGTFERFTHDPESPATISSNRINAIDQDDAGLLWIATDMGLNAFDPANGSFDRYANDPGDRYSLPHDNVLSIYQDRGGVMWVGTYDGLSKWRPSVRAMRHYRNDAKNPASLSEDTVTSFAAAPEGDFWIGTFGGGLNLLDSDTGQFRQFRHSPDDPTSLSSDRVMALYTDSDGVLWAGTRAAGLNRYDAVSNAFSRFQHDPENTASISSNGITAIIETSDKRLWIGTFGGGINLYDPDTQSFTRLRNDPADATSLSNDRVLVLFEDSAGIVWIGTYGGGLNRFDPSSGVFSVFRGEPYREDGLSGDEIYMIQEDIQGDLWIGVKGAGLNRWTAAERAAGRLRVQRFGELHGLPSATIYSGIWDDSGHLWLSTARGVSRLNVDTLEFRNYDTSHGLQGDEFNLAAGFRAPNGQVMFGGMNGFNLFQPAELNGGRPPPPVAITNFLAMNEPVDLVDARLHGSQPKLNHNQNVIGFEFAALDFAAPENSHYRYRLDGLDDDWVDAGNKRQVTYTNLPAGDYIFRVRAQNNDGIWSEAEAKLAFSMAPAPWRTWWAYASYAILLTSLLLMAIRTQNKRTVQAARLRYVDELDLLQSRLSEAQRIASLGNWDWNTVTNELWWSDEVYRLFRKERPAFGGTYQAFLECVHPDDRDVVNNAVESALRGDEPYAIDHRILRDDGSERIVHERAEVTFDDSNVAIRMAGTVHDITERKLAEEDVRHQAMFQELLANLSTELLQTRPYDIDRQLTASLEAIAVQYQLDSISTWWFGDDRQSMRAAHRCARVDSNNRITRLSRTDIPWIAEQVLAGEMIVIDDVDEMPVPAMTDQKILRSRGTKSCLIIPLRVDDSLEGACVYSTRREFRRWDAGTVTELRLLAENLASAVARSRAMVEIEQLKNQLQAENLYLREEVKLAHGFDEIVGEDRKLKKCLQAVEKVAPTDIPVLVLGETGTGKELIARAVHKLSNRKDRPMVSVNCPALPANLIESELFGHEKGAFTGAEASRRGRFELADGGTLFLDEIGELPLELQVKLLRVLQTGEYERLGGTETRRTDIRLIAATNRNLEQAIDNGAFRSDLYYRIASFPIRLPPLRTREADIPLLAEHFVHKHAGRLNKRIEAISAKMLKELLDYDWPGNVRELESIVERSLISAESNSVLELPGPLRLITGFVQTRDTLLDTDAPGLHDVERAHILKVLQQSDWKVSGPNGAAAVLGIPASTLRSKMKRLGIDKRIE